MSHLKKDVSIPSRRDVVRSMKQIKEALLVQIAARLEGQHLSCTTDGWTSRANGAYRSFTVSLIDDSWDMKTLSLDCSEEEAAAATTGSATSTTGGAGGGGDLAGSVMAQVKKHKLEGRVVAFTTDCEPSSVKAGRVVEEKGVAEHHDCCNHRLECTAGIVLDGPGVRETMALARLLVRRYTTSSQAARRLEDSLEYLKMVKREVVQDVERRWRSTHACLERLLYLRSAINMHEAVISGSSSTSSARILSDTHWSVIEYVVPLLEPLVSVQRELEAEKHVTISLVVPNIMRLRIGLRAALEELRADPPIGTPAHQLEARAIVIPVANALAADFDRHWGDGTSVLRYYKTGPGSGPRQQPRGFKRWQLVATALDWRTKDVLFGFTDDEKDGLWELVVKETTALVLVEEERKSAHEIVSAPPPPLSAHVPAAPPVVPEGEGEGAATTAVVVVAPPPPPPSKKPRLNGFSKNATQSQPVQAAASDDDDDDDGGGGNGGADSSSSRDDGCITDAVRVEVAAFRTSGGMPMSSEEADEEGTVRTTYNNPLDMWREKASEFPKLASVARRVLAIPATQAQSDRMFSAAGLTADKRRGSLDPENVELLVFLRCNWAAVEEWQR